MLLQINYTAYRLDLPSQLNIHNVINFKHLNLDEPSFIEEKVHMSHPINHILYFQPRSIEDTFLYKHTQSTHQK